MDKTKTEKTETPMIPNFIKRSELAKRMYPTLGDEARIKLTQKIKKFGTARILPADIKLMKDEFAKMIIELKKAIDNE